VSSPFRAQHCVLATVRRFALRVPFELFFLRGPAAALLRRHVDSLVMESALTHNTTSEQGRRVCVSMLLWLVVGCRSPRILVCVRNSSIFPQLPENAGKLIDATSATVASRPVLAHSKQYQRKSNSTDHCNDLSFTVYGNDHSINKISMVMTSTNLSFFFKDTFIQFYRRLKLCMFELFYC